MKIHVRIKDRSKAMASTIAAPTKFDRKVIILGFLDNQSNSDIIYHLILLFKKVSYENHKNRFEINVTSFQFHVASVYEIENKIVKKPKKLKLIYVNGRPL